MEVDGHIGPPEFQMGFNSTFYAWEIRQRGRNYPAAYFNDAEMCEMVVNMLNAHYTLYHDPHYKEDGLDHD